MEAAAARVVGWAIIAVDVVEHPLASVTVTV
jgi:hypothetical protein